MSDTSRERFEKFIVDTNLTTALKHGLLISSEHEQLVDGIGRYLINKFKDGEYKDDEIQSQYLAWQASAESSQARIAELEESVKYWQRDSASAWDKCEERRLETLSLESRVKELTDLVKHMRPKFGDIGTRDVDVVETQRMFDEALSTTPTTSLDKFRNEVIDECAEMARNFRDEEGCVEAIRALKKDII